MSYSYPGQFAVTRPAISLKPAAAFWLGVMLLGQWAFFYYIVMHYGGSLVSGNWEVWNRLSVFKVFPFVAGDRLGNLTFLGHALAAGIIALGGALQLVPQIRNRFPTLHRWNGRIFLLTVVALSLSGFYLVWIRSAKPAWPGAAALSLNGVLILAFAAAAWRAVRRRDFAAHREWAIRLYLVSNGQWFIRIGMFGYMVFVKATGFAPIPTGQFFKLWQYGCYLVPLALLQLYFVAGRSQSRPLRVAVYATLVSATVAMALGIVVFTAFSQKIITGAPLSMG